MKAGFVSKCVTVLVSLFLVAEAVVVRDYNKVNFVEYESLQDFSDAVMNGEENVLTQNVFLGVAEQHCKHHLESPAFRGAQRHGGGDVLLAATVPVSELRSRFESFDTAPTLNNCAQVFFYRIGDTINEPTSKTENFDHASLNRWMAESMRTNFKFINHFSFPITIFWHEESTEPVESGRLEPGHSMEMGSFLGHIFSASADEPVEGIAQNEEQPEEEESSPAFVNVVDFMTVDGQDYAFAPINRLETCEIVPGTPTQFAADNQLMTCENMKLRLIEFTHVVWYEKRLGLNFVQPQLVRPVTHNGFEHRQLPPATYKWLKAWYDREQYRIEVTESIAGPCMNQHVAPSAMTHLTASNKERLSRDMKAILEEWYGGELQLTSIYGIRKYVNGSVLRMHVDTVNTHVVSAIINVDQEVEEDWPLIILDHNDQEHSIVMKPGDMVLYESAKLLHGRPDVLNGKHYDNIFIHYQPTSGWDYSWL